MIVSLNIHFLHWQRFQALFLLNYMFHSHFQLKESFLTGWKSLFVGVFVFTVGTLGYVSIIPPNDQCVRCVISTYNNNVPNFNCLAVGAICFFALLLGDIPWAIGSRIYLLLLGLHATFFNNWFRLLGIYQVDNLMMIVPIRYGLECVLYNC